MNESIIRALDGLMAAVNDFAAGCEAAIVVFDELAFECLALFWARVNRPEWVYISTHHRKRRIRKKYHDRILREYERRNRNG